MKILGIDVGGTNVKAIYFDGTRLKSFFLPTPKTKAQFSKLLADLFDSCGKVDRVGFGLPGQVDYFKARVTRIGKLPYLNNLDLKKIVRDLSGNPKIQIKLDNDVNCHLNAELKFGVAAKFKNVVMIAIGTGIGGGIAIDGKIYRGSAGSAGEIGHIILDKGKYYQDLASGKILRSYSPTEIKKVAHYTAQACVSMVNVLNPDVLVLSGGVVHRSKVFQETSKYLKKYGVSSAKNTKVLISSLGEFGGALGAAWL